MDAIVCVATFSVLWCIKLVLYKAKTCLIDRLFFSLDFILFIIMESHFDESVQNREALRTLLRKWIEIGTEIERVQAQKKVLLDQIKSLTDDRLKFQNLIMDMMRSKMPDVMVAAKETAVGVSGTNASVRVMKQTRIEPFSKAVLKRNALLYFDQQSIQFPKDKIDDLIKFIYANRERTTTEVMKKVPGPKAPPPIADEMHIQSAIEKMDMVTAMDE